MSWREVAGLNEIIDVGCYVVQLKHGAGKDELPLPACNKEHYITATLIVTESGTDDTLQKNRVIGQTLILPQCDDGNVAMYSRSYSLLGKGYKWSFWSRTQQNAQVGMVTSLDDFTSSGIYSGVYSVAGGSPETFMLTVIDGSATAADNGIICISQFKNSLNVDGTFSYRTRVGRGKGSITWGSWVDLGAADTADIQDNSITSQKLSADVREKVNSPLRSLYNAAGAEYNDSVTDKTKTTFFGDEVVHKAGHYYLNGLGDITEAQMAAIYAAGKIFTYNNTGRFRAYARTTLPSTITGGEGRGHLNFYYICALNKSIETFDATDRRYVSNVLTVEDLGSAFMGCENLKYIYNVLSVASVDSASKINAFNCPKLIEVRLGGLKVGVKFDKCPEISQQSVLYAIQNASPTSAITITLHPDAYARLADDADVVAALEAQQLVSLVSA